MRHIPLGSRRPDTAWLARAADALAKVDAEKDIAKRNKLIDDSAKIWGDLKVWLLDLSKQRCWFSEAQDCFSHWDVEHYRPKKSAQDLDGMECDGYWWLAFAWENLRICGNAGNRKKGTYFPMRPGSTRVAPYGDTRREDPMLLDPIDADDPLLLFFDVEGKAIPAPHVTDAWERERVVYSVMRYNLDFPPLTDKRKVMWAECSRAIDDYIRELTLYYKDSTNQIARVGVRKAAQVIHKLISGEFELSSVARACVQSRGDKRLDGFLRSI